MARFDMHCPQCLTIQLIRGPIGQVPDAICSDCGTKLEIYFGSRNEDGVYINYGFRPHRYDNETDRGIAQWRFENA